MKRIGVLVVAYNAASTLAAVLDRIPREFVPRIEKILVTDDFSQDSTFLVGLGYQQAFPDLPLEIIRHPRNLGYGGNQKAGYRWAIEHGLDIVVLLHGDGQYAPELLPQMVAPLERGEADAVFGSRMMNPGEARRGGMPAYKYIGNKILTRFQNKVAGAALSEWHSGYRAYSVSALRELPLDQNSDAFDFDTQVILQLIEARMRIEEIPIPTFYGDEICYVNGLGYAGDVTRAVLRYRAHKMGLGTGETAFAEQHYALKHGEATSHGRILEMLGRVPPGRILDLGCDDGSLGERLRLAGHEVTGVDVHKHEGVGDRLDRFLEADLDRGIPSEAGDGYDIILAADVLEHVRRPDELLRDIRSRLGPGGTLVTSVPNFGHWYPRVRVASGRFDYDRRGILDQGHLRFFTRRSFEHLAARSGYEVRRREVVGLPFEVGRRGCIGHRPRAAPGSWRASTAWPPRSGPPCSATSSSTSSPPSSTGDRHVRVRPRGGSADPGAGSDIAPGVSHLPGWDGLRAVAATSVLVLHTAVLRLPDNPGLQDVVAQLQAGVEVFFVASGFMVARPFIRAIVDGRPLPGLRRYGVRRATRILPAYWLALVVSELVLGTTHLSGLREWITQLLLIQVYWGDQFTGGISVAWTLSVEVTFYALLPLFSLGVARVARRVSPWRALVGSLVVVILAGWAWIAWTVATGRFLQIFWFPFFMPLFATGMLLCVAAEYVTRNPAAVRAARQVGRLAPLWWGASLGFLLLAAAMFGSEVLYRAQHAGGTALLYSAIAVCAAIPIAIGFRADSVGGRLLTSRPLVYVGLVSYGIYIWHHQLTTWMSQHLFGWNQYQGSALLVTVSVFAATVGVASLSWFLVERPMQRLSRGVT